MSKTELMWTLTVLWADGEPVGDLYADITPSAMPSTMVARLSIIRVRNLLLVMSLILSSPTSYYCRCGLYAERHVPPIASA